MITILEIYKPKYVFGPKHFIESNVAHIQLICVHKVAAFLCQNYIFLQMIKKIFKS
jgi:hypothetical protein